MAYIIILVQVLILTPYKILVQKPEKKRPLWCPSHRCEDHTKMTLKEIKGVRTRSEWVQERGLIETVMSLHIPQKVVSFNQISDYRLVKKNYAHRIGSNYKDPKMKTNKYINK